MTHLRYEGSAAGATHGLETGMTERMRRGIRVTPQSQFKLHCEQDSGFTCDDFCPEGRHENESE